MKAQLLHLNSNLEHSFNARRDNTPQYHNLWHYHEELELIYFAKGSGTQFIGDSVRRFESGDITLVGSNLPHYWLFDEIYLQDEGAESADIRVIHFKENFWGNDFINLPENKSIKDLIRVSKRGISLLESSRLKTVQLIDAILAATGTTRIIHLLEILQYISAEEQHDLLTSPTFTIQLQDQDANRMQLAMQYIGENYRDQIRLQELASLTGMTPNSFCRYFKSQIGKTLFQFLIEMRVKTACNLLIENKQTVKQICFESGFQNFSSFHKYFKNVTGTTPLSFQRSKT
ncbi:MAG: AraC family transcriptional regulator [Sphingobacterium sp.]|jgi:AraC-like DNA-binding protein|uniref:AraC family transcriptional regulator n=1 Tax=Sphingobacterium sp. TaxID=341027 RepID=UPI00283D4793|nr:AraC family transcriptional regulator [Sphingobacterium sp.]MDR3007867.1 AraC family transcriptional regulator [Sphingobacterium sp.]